MARILYALSGQGRGHTSRAMATSEALRARSHEVVFCCGGTAREILESRGERVLPIPALRQVMKANRVCLRSTLRRNWKRVLCAPRITRRLARAFEAQQADLLITDFEAFAPRAARRIGLPVLSFNHQQIVTETRYPLPLRHWSSAALTKAAIGVIAPRRPRHVLITSFFFPELKRPDRTTLVPPIVRPAVQDLEPDRSSGHVLVYYNQSEGAEAVLEALRRVDARFVVYNFGSSSDHRAERYPNITFKRPSLEGFLADLAGSRAVICTAGFTLISEGLYLGKPLLVAPNGGIFEQIINARFLEKDGLGEAVSPGSRLTPPDVRGFLDRAPRYADRLRDRRRSGGAGNDAAVACIERVLASVGAPDASSSPPLSRVPDTAAPERAPTASHASGVGNNGSSNNGSSSSSDGGAPAEPQQQQHTATTSP